VDTPGQIEIFTWSASGAIITETLAASFPTVIAYIIDTPRTTNSSTFMSNMLYACSILYKTKLPFVLVFNKTDVVSHEFAIDWMTDNEAFQVQKHPFFFYKHLRNVVYRKHSHRKRPIWARSSGQCRSCSRSFTLI